MKLQLFKNYGSADIALDPDYVIYKNRVTAFGGTLDPSKETLFNQLFVSIRSAGLRDKFRFLWIHLGDWNASRIPQYFYDPLNIIDGSGLYYVRLIGFVSADYSQATGYQGAVGKYAYIDYGFGTLMSGLSSYGQTVYSHTSGAYEDVLMSALGGSPLTIYRILPHWSNGEAHWATLVTNNTWIPGHSSQGQGFITTNRKEDGTHEVQRQNTIIATPTMTNGNIAQLNSAVPSFFGQNSYGNTPRRLSLFAYHEAFTLAEHNTFWGIYQTLCAGIGRSLP